MFQHPNKDNSGVPQLIVTRSGTATKGPIACLPDTYTSIPPATRIKQDPPVPQLTGPYNADCQIISQAVEEEYRLVQLSLLLIDNFSSFVLQMVEAFEAGSSYRHGCLV